MASRRLISNDRRRLVIRTSLLQAVDVHAASGPSTLIKDHLAGGASRLAALLLPQILPVFSVVAPCHPGAALRDLVLVQRGRATSMRRAALRPGAPMMPPPGCAADPH